MDKDSLTKRVLSKISEKDILKLVSNAKNNPVDLVNLFDLNFKKAHNLEDIKNIFIAIEKSGHINQHNLSVWKKIYDNLGIIYPVTVKE